MSSLRKFFSLSARDRWLLVQAWLLLSLLRVGLWLLPFRIVHRLVAAQRVFLPRPGRAPHVTSERIGWAVTIAGSYVPCATCLPQALAAQVLLRRAGYRAQTRIGVAHGGERRLEAHAWVECAGQIIFGGSTDALTRYTPLPPILPERHHVGR